MVIVVHGANYDAAVSITLAENKTLCEVFDRVGAEWPVDGVTEHLDAAEIFGARSSMRWTLGATTNSRPAATRRMTTRGSRPLHAGPVTAYLARIDSDSRSSTHPAR